MRIIDADEVIDLIDGETKVETNSNVKAFNDALEVAIQIIDTQKTVEAIPIEWIKRYIAEEGIYPNRELLSVEQADAIERMIENWEKENADNN